MKLLDRHDFTATLRSLRRSPGFVAIATISLGLAIGIATTTFAIVDAVKHPYVAYEDPDQLQGVWMWAVGIDRRPHLEQRTRELAMRIALGARGADLFQSDAARRRGARVGGTCFGAIVAVYAGQMQWSS